MNRIVAPAAASVVVGLLLGAAAIFGITVMVQQDTKPPLPGAIRRRQCSTGSSTATVASPAAQAPRPELHKRQLARRSHRFRADGCCWWQPSRWR